MQAYGLLEYLKENGHEVCIIDYRPTYLTRKYVSPKGWHFWFPKSPVRTLKKWLSEPFLHHDRIRRWNGFQSFIDKRLALAPYKIELLQEYDAIIVGSDQIWNNKLTGNSFDDVFFGKSVRTKLISYAASAAFTQLSEAEKEYFHDKLKRFTAVGVREDRLRELIQPLTEKPVITTLDPTLLAGNLVFDRIAERPKAERFVFVYDMNTSRQVLQIAKKIADQLNCGIIELNAWPSIRNKKPNSRKYQATQGASPEEFLGLIKHAACIVTSSFHGTALSLLFMKPFYTVRQGKSIDCRYESLLQKFGLQKRLINMDDRPDFEEIDYLHIKEAFKTSVRESEDFIKKALAAG